MLACVPQKAIAGGLESETCVELKDEEEEAVAGSPTKDGMEAEKSET